MQNSIDLASVTRREKQTDPKALLTKCAMLLYVNIPYSPQTHTHTHTQTHTANNHNNHTTTKHTPPHTQTQHHTTTNTHNTPARTHTQHSYNIHIQTDSEANYCATVSLIPLNSRPVGKSSLVSSAVLCHYNNHHQPALS